MATAQFTPAQMQIKKVDAAQRQPETGFTRKKWTPSNVFFGTTALANGWVIAGNYGNVVYALDQPSRQPGVVIQGSTLDKGRFIAGPVVAG